MKFFMFLLLALTNWTLFSQKTTIPFSSKKLDQERQISIILPESYNEDNSKKYPLLLLLDGDYLLDPFEGAIRYGNYWDDIPEIIIVGIHQGQGGQRYRDTVWDEEDGIPIETGADFYDFIGSELMPHLHKEFRIAPFKIIAGHDNTAGFLNFFLYQDNPMFDAYISLSPELATNMETIIAKRLSDSKRKTYYYLSSADGDFKAMRERIFKLDENIRATNNSHVNYLFDDFQKTSHYSLVLFSIPNALYQLFAVYQPISIAEFQEHIVTMESGYVDYLIEKYNTIEKSLNIKMPIRLTDFKAIEAAILRNAAYDDLDKLAQLAKKYYPKSMLADYHLGLMYEKTGDLKRAQKSFFTAFQKDPIGDLTKDMMFERSEDMKRLMNRN